MKEARAALPEPWREPRERRRASDGSEFALTSRVVDLDPLEQRLTYEMRAQLWRDDELVDEEMRTLHINLYFKNELLMMLQRVGFLHLRIEGDHTGRSVTNEETFLVGVGTAFASGGVARSASSPAAH